VVCGGHFRTHARCDGDVEVAGLRMHRSVDTRCGALPQGVIARIDVPIGTPCLCKDGEVTQTYRLRISACHCLSGAI
jgi:hypothetical protein